MSDVIDLSSERDRRSGPDAEFVSTDRYGRKMFSFCFEYQMNGKLLVLSVPAYDFEHAEQQCVAIRESLVLAGQTYSESPA